MAITKIDRTVLRAIEPAILAKLNETLGAEFGLFFQFKGGNFTESSAVLKLELAVKSADGIVIDRTREEYTKYSQLVGLKAEWLDTTYSDFSGREYKITGLNLKKRKNCVMITETRTGKKYVTSAETVIRAKSVGSPSAKSASGLDFVVGTKNPNHAEIERRIGEMRNNCPEGYYGDGEHQAAGMSERQIHDMHYVSIAKQIVAEKSGKPPLFGKK